jgi:hypothetical protein
MKHAATLAAIAVAMAALTGCGSSAGTTSIPSAATSSSSTTASGLTVTPSSGGPTTVFSARFTAPASSSTGRGARIGYTLGLTGSGAGHCIAVRSVPITTAVKRRPVLVTLDPARLGGRWCPGAHTARVLELQRPRCAAGIMCPQFVRVIAVIGTATFEVRP